jgi:hypothetical protein
MTQKLRRWKCRNQNQGKVIKGKRRGALSMGLSQVRETKSCDIVWRKLPLLQQVGESVCVRLAVVPNCAASHPRRLAVDILDLCIPVGKKVKLSLGTPRRHMGCSGDTASLIVNFNAKWSQAVTFIPWLVYLQIKSPWRPLYRNVSGFQNWSGCFGEETNLLPMPGIKVLWEKS